jgi:Leucine-rich repeat (LRR) protein
MSPADLTILNLAHNKLANLPDVFHRLPHLAILVLDDNRVEYFPPSITGLTKLKVG